MKKPAAALVQIGQLLTKSGLLSHDDLAEALIRAKRNGLPIGTELLTMGSLRQGALRAAVEAQSLVNDGLLEFDLAISALRKCGEDGATLEQSLSSLGWQSKTASVTNKLGELLLDADLLTEGVLAECLATSLETGMLLGSVLTFQRALTEDELVAALHAQRVVRQGTLSRPEAVNALREVKRRKITLEQSLEGTGVALNRNNSPVGYLLVDAGLVKEVDLMMCVELSLTASKPIVESLVEREFTSKELAQSCLQLQQMVDGGILTKELAVSALKLLAEENVFLGRAVAKACLPAISAETRELLRELFVLTGYFEPGDVPPLNAEQFAQFDEFCTKVTQTGKIADYIVDAMVRALYLIELRVLVAEDAIMALHYCRKHQTTLDDALEIMGWKPRRADS